MAITNPTMNYSFLVNSEIMLDDSIEKERAMMD